MYVDGILVCLICALARGCVATEHYYPMLLALRASKLSSLANCVVLLGSSVQYILPLA